jgi:Sugar (and other) transporter
VALLFNVFVNPIALASIAWKYYFVFIAVLVFAIITIWFAYPETRGHSLEEMALVFDGEDAVIPSSSEVLRTDEHTEIRMQNMSIVPQVSHEEVHAVAKV